MILFTRWSLSEADTIRCKIFYPEEDFSFIYYLHSILTSINQSDPNTTVRLREIALLKRLSWVKYENTNKYKMKIDYKHKTYRPVEFDSVKACVLRQSSYHKQNIKDEYKEGHQCREKEKC